MRAPIFSLITGNTKTHCEKHLLFFKFQIIILSVILFFYFMKSQILTISDRGQITLPKKYRDNLKIKYVTIRIDGKNVVLEPLQTREEFFKELEEAEKDWEKHGGITLEEMKKKYKF